MDKRYTRLAKNIGLLTVGKALAKVVSILILPFYTKYLSPADFGSVDLILAYAALFTTPVGLCIESAVFVFSANKTDAKKRRYFSSALYLSVIPISLFITVLWSLRLLCGNSSETSFIGSLTGHAGLLTIVILTSFLSGLVQQVLRSLDKIRLYATTGVVQAFVMMGLCLFVLPRWGVKGYLFSLVFSSSLTICIMYTSGRLWQWFSWRDVSWKYYCQMLRFSIPLIPAPILLWAQTSLNRPLLAANWGTVAVGIFGFACKFPGMLNYFADSFCRAWEISAIQEIKRKNFEQFYQKLIKGFILGGSLVAILVTILICPVFKFLVDEKFYDAIQYIPVVMFSMFTLLAAQLLGTNMTICRESKKFLYSSIVAVISAGTSNCILIPLYGVWGAVGAMTFASVAVLTARWFMQQTRFQARNQAVRIVVWLSAFFAWAVIYQHMGTVVGKIEITTAVVLFLIALFVKEVKQGVAWLWSMKF